jgi:hypothetical protein
MGFSAPKPDPAIAAQQAAAAADAKRQKISAVTDQLQNEDQIRARLYGARKSLFDPSSLTSSVAPNFGGDKGGTSLLLGSLLGTPVKF